MYLALSAQARQLIIGQSGSGKTVLMKSLVGLLHPEEGEILFDGRNIMQMSTKEMKEPAQRNRHAISGFCAL